MPDSDDGTLIKSILDGDVAAFEKLIRRYQRAVWGMVHRTLGNSAEAEDAVQETFIRAYMSLKRFDRRCPFKPWVLRITANYCIDQLRRSKTRKQMLWSELSETEQKRLLETLTGDGGKEFQATADAERFAPLIRSLLDELNPKHRMAFVLRELEGRSYNQVAEILGTSNGSARVRVARARADLQNRFHRHMNGIGRRETL